MNKKISILALFLISFILVKGQEFRVNFQENKDFQSALNLAESQKKLVFIDFYTTWCAPCKTMDKEVFTVNFVGDYLNKGFVNLKIDAEAGEGINLAKKFKVRAFPTFLVLDAKGNEVHRILGASPANLFVELLQKSLDNTRSPEALKKRFEKGERSPQLINDYAFSVMETGDEDAGYKIVNDYFHSLKKKKRAHLDNLFLYERYSATLKDFKAVYLLENKDAFIKGFGAEKTNSLLHRFLRLELLPYVSGNYGAKGFDPVAYDAVKKKIEAVNLPDSLSLKNVIKISDARKGAIDLSFIETCEKVFPGIVNRDRFLVLLSFSELTKSEDTVLKQRASNLIKDYLDEMPAHSLPIIKRIGFDLATKSDVIGIQFEKLSFQEALKKAKAENKLVFVDAFASWCGPCKIMDENVFPNQEVGEFFNSNFVNFQIDMEKGEGPALQKKYPINAFPTFLLIDGEGNEIHRIVGGFESQPFIAAIKKGMTKENSLSFLKSSYEADKENAIVVKNYALALKSALDRRGYATVINTYFDGLSDQDKKTLKNSFVYTGIDSFKDPKFIYFYANRDAIKITVGEKEFEKIIDQICGPILMSYQGSFKQKDFLSENFPQLLTLKFAENSETTAVMRLMNLAGDANLDGIITLLKKDLRNFSDKNRLFALYQLLSIPLKGTEEQKRALQPLLKSALADNPSPAIKESMEKFLKRLEESM